MIETRRGYYLRFRDCIFLINRSDVNTYVWQLRGKKAHRYSGGIDDISPRELMDQLVNGQHEFINKHDDCFDFKIRTK